MGQGHFPVKKDLARVGDVCQVEMSNVGDWKPGRGQKGRGFEPGCLEAVCRRADRDSWNLVLAPATPTLESHWLVLLVVGLGLRARCPGSSRACHSATPRPQAQAFSGSLGWR